MSTLSKIQSFHTSAFLNIITLIKFNSKMLMKAFSRKGLLAKCSPLHWPQSFCFATSNAGKSQTQDLLSQKNLSLCSPLMRSILSKESKREIKIKEDQYVKQQAQNSAEESKHDLQNFRHMLAGPLLSQANLDKFCVKKPSPLVADIKYDGERTMINYEKGQSVRMISRNGKSQDDFYSRLNEKIKYQLDQIGVQSIKLDGEIVAVEKDTFLPLPFGDLLKQKKLISNQPEIEVQSSTIVLLVYIFDVLQINGKSLLEDELIQRRKLIPKVDIFKPAQYRIIHFPQQRTKIFQFFKQAVERKYEGLILKGSKDKYFTNQSRTHWKKLKRGFANNRDTKIAKIELDLIVMGANRGQGSKNYKSFTSYLLGTKYNNKIIPISNVGSGLTDQMMELINKHMDDNNLKVELAPDQYQLGAAKADIYFKPQLIFEVNAQEFSVSPLYRLGGGQFGGLSLRFPVFKGIRTDKGVNEATKGEQILELSKSFNLNLPV